MYDSSIDILLHSEGEHVSETVTAIHCKHDSPAILSHHDVILSAFTIPTEANNPSRKLHDIAPKLDHTRTRIEWSEDGIKDYCELVEPCLREAVSYG